MHIKNRTTRTRSAELTQNKQIVGENGASRRDGNAGYVTFDWRGRFARYPHTLAPSAPTGRRGPRSSKTCLKGGLSEKPESAWPASCATRMCGRERRGFPRGLPREAPALQRRVYAGPRADSRSGGSPPPTSYVATRLSRESPTATPKATRRHNCRATKL